MVMFLGHTRWHQPKKGGGGGCPSPPDCGDSYNRIIHYHYLSTTICAVVIHLTTPLYEFRWMGPLKFVSPKIHSINVRINWGTHYQYTIVAEIFYCPIKIPSQECIALHTSFPYFSLPTYISSDDISVFWCGLIALLWYKHNGIHDIP